jgi:hypothetical protein
VGASAELIYRLIADFDRHHPRFLPPPLRLDGYARTTPPG